MAACLDPGAAQLVPVSLFGAMTKHSQVIGSPAYNSPETFENRPISTDIDIYAFGMCVLEIVTRGEAPYEECQGVFRLILYQNIICM